MEEKCEGTKRFLGYREKYDDAPKGNTRWDTHYWYAAMLKVPRILCLIFSIIICRVCPKPFQDCWGSQLFEF